MNGPGRIEVICGPMFAGKTEELLRRVRRAVVAGREVQVFHHAIDTRGGGRVVSHVGLGHPSVAASTAGEIEGRVADRIGIVAIDEAQFFGPDLVGVASRLADGGSLVLIAGLDVTFEGLPFEPLPSLMALAERVDKLTAICTICGEEAVFHVRLTASPADARDLVPEHIGSGEKYQARCRRHFAPA